MDEHKLSRLRGWLEARDYLGTCTVEASQVGVVDDDMARLLGRARELFGDEAVAEVRRTYGLTD